MPRWSSTAEANGREVSTSGARCSTTSSPGMKVYDDEVFGPVLSVVRVATYDEAVALVNANPYGNGVALFTRDGGAARRFQLEVTVGMVGINVPVPVPVGFHSFGGWKSSLFGDNAIYGPEGIRFYTRPKVVTSRWPDPAEQRHRPGLPTDPLERRRPHSISWADSRGQREKMPAPVLAAASTRSFHSRSPHGGSTSCDLGEQLGQPLRRGPGVMRITLPAAEDEGRHVNGSRQRHRASPGTSSSGRGQYASIHCSSVSMKVLGSWASELRPVLRVALQHLGPFREGRHRLHPVPPRRRDRVAAVVACRGSAARRVRR